MNNIFIYYPKCSTCIKAKKYLDSKNIKYTERHIVDEVPTYEELKEIIQISMLPINKFFNTSGMLYRSMNLKEKLGSLSDDEKIKLLSSNGKLIKRPIFINNDKVYLGFKEAEWKEIK